MPKFSSPRSDFLEKHVRSPCANSVGYTHLLSFHHGCISDVVPWHWSSHNLIFPSKKGLKGSIIWRYLWVVCCLYSTTSQDSEDQYAVSSPLSSILSYNSFLQRSCWQSSPLLTSGISRQRGHICTPELKIGLFMFHEWPQKCLCIELDSTR